MRDCPSKRVLVVKNDGEYSSTSELDEDILALLAADHAGSEGARKNILMQLKPTAMRA
jgi:hypothetical protein